MKRKFTKYPSSYVKADAYIFDKPEFYDRVFDQAIEQIEWADKLGKIADIYDIDEIGAILEKYLDEDELFECMKFNNRFLYDIRDSL